MKSQKILFAGILLALSLSMSAQNKISLLPDNMIKFIGHTTRPKFEEIVGKPVDESNGFIVYEVENTYDNEITAIRCFYRESDGELISIKFGTTYYLAYWIGFSKLKGYIEKVNAVIHKNAYGNIVNVNLKLNTFGCQILDIIESSNGSTAAINYHTVAAK